MRRVLLTLALGLPLPAWLTACGDDSAPVGTESGGTSGASRAGETSSEAAGQPSEGGTGAATASGGTGSEAGSESGGAGSTSGGSSSASSGSGGMTGYLPCESKADCDAFGGGKVCCVVGAMHFCTKPSACPGDTLP